MYSKSASNEGKGRSKLNEHVSVIPLRLCSIKVLSNANHYL